MTYLNKALMVFSTPYNVRIGRALCSLSSMHLPVHTWGDETRTFFLRIWTCLCKFQSACTDAFVDVSYPSVKICFFFKCVDSEQFNIQTGSGHLMPCVEHYFFLCKIGLPESVCICFCLFYPNVMQLLFIQLKDVCLQIIFILLYEEPLNWNLPADLFSKLNYALMHLSRTKKSTCIVVGEKSRHLLLTHL